MPSPSLLQDPVAALDTGSALQTLASYAGIDVRPRHAQWVTLERTTRNRETGLLKQDKGGDILVTIELLPKPLATKFPAGLGRSEPNQFPVLPKPAGRVRCSANPCYLFNACCGEKVFTAFVLTCICIVVVVVAILGAPFVQAIQVRPCMREEDWRGLPLETYQWYMELRGPLPSRGTRASIGSLRLAAGLHGVHAAEVSDRHLVCPGSLHWGPASLLLLPLRHLQTAPGLSASRN
jgi:hypothetical protein